MFELLDEIEDATGVRWTLQSIDDDGGLHRSSVRLAWADYDVLCPDGAIAPARVAEAVVTFVLGRLEFDPLPELLDAAIARRRVAGADRLIVELLRA